MQALPRFRLMTLTQQQMSMPPLTWSQTPRIRMMTTATLTMTPVLQWLLRSIKPLLRSRVCRDFT